jgi:hypothetical protein
MSSQEIRRRLDGCRSSCGRAWARALGREALTLYTMFGGSDEKKGYIEGFSAEAREVGNDREQSLSPFSTVDQPALFMSVRRESA